MKDIIHGVIDSLTTLKDEKRLEFAKRTHPSSLKIIGVTNPNCKIILKELKQSSEHYSQKEKLELLKQLYKCRIFECQFIAIEYLGSNKQLLQSLSQHDLIDLNRNMDNWVSVDTFSTQVLGAAWRLGVVNDDFILALLKSEDHWQRRMAVVSTIALNLKSRGGLGDSSKTIMICKLVVDDHHKMIYKALSWALRELTKKDNDIVSEFLNSFEDRLHPSVIREVNNKLNYNLKTPRG